MDEADERVSALIVQLRSNDVDVKIDALGKLQTEFESGTTVNDSEGVVNALKACLRTPNLHLVAATLSALVPALTALLSRNISPSHTQHLPSPSASTSTASISTSVVDIFLLRQVLNAFLPVGGLFERLGDKDKIQTKAREALVLLGGYAFRAGSGGAKAGKGPETPFALYERLLRESGFGSKNWKVREQCVLTLVYIRREHHTFPLRPYLPLLVEALEDTDAHVRDCARVSVIELFTGPAVTDAARADLKKEMVKKGTRKTIVEGVLSQILGGGGSAGSNPASREGSESGDPPRSKGYVPPSLALKGQKPAAIPRTVSQSVARDIPRPLSRAATSSPIPSTDSADIKAVYIASARDLESEFAGMTKAFDGKETEHNWAMREKSVNRVRSMLKGDVHTRYQDVFMACLKDNFIQLSLKTLASLRTTVTMNTCSLYCELAIALGNLMDPFCELLMNNLLKMAGFTKKLAAQQTQAAAACLITNTSGTPRVFLPAIWNNLQDKNVQTRTYMIQHFKTYLIVHGQPLRHQIESSGGMDIMDKALRKSLVDPNPAVKEGARVSFWAFDEVWHERAVPIMETLDGVARKQLEKACPNPDAVAALPPTTPRTTKKTSVAAAIAASRAKAKAIATAPPSLRHQATSASQSSPRRPSSTSPQRPLQKSPVLRPSSPLRMSTSPPSQRPRVPSAAPANTRSFSSANMRGHSRSPSGGSSRPISPPSSDEHPSVHRSSPLVGRTSLPMRQALNTALPASPDSQSPTPVPRTARASSAMHLNRMSVLLPPYNADDPGSLLIAQNVPLPDGDSEFDELERSMNLMSFSQTMDQIPLMEQTHREWEPPKASSQVQSLSPKSVDSRLVPAGMNALSSDSVADMAATGQPGIVEDALRARAEQAESAAERLLELNESEDEGLQNPILPSSLTNGNGKARPVPVPMPNLKTNPPFTPVNRATAVMRQAALFQDSPAYSRSSTLVDILQDRKHETGWWLKRKALLAKKRTDPTTELSPAESLANLVADLETGNCDLFTIQTLTLLSVAHPADTSSVNAEFFPSSPTPFTDKPLRPSSPGHIDIWGVNRTFDRLLSALLRFLDPTQSEEILEYGLILVFELLDNQWAHVEGREAEIFSALLQIRYCSKSNVLEATNTIRDSLSAKVEPVYGLATLHSSLKAFQEQAPPAEVDPDSKPGTYAFGLMALGKFILRLPAEIAEEEIPHLKTTLIKALSDKSSLVTRESAAAAIIAAQLVLRDEVHLFTLLDGLPDDKKNLLTYLFDKHGARGVLNSQNGIDKLDREMKRLDTRTSTPKR